MLTLSIPLAKRDLVFVPTHSSIFAILPSSLVVPPITRGLPGSATVRVQVALFDVALSTIRARATGRPLLLCASDRIAIAIHHCNP